MDSSFWFDTINLGWSIVYIEGHRLWFPKNIAFLSLKTVFVLVNSAVPDEMPHYVAFHLGLHCQSTHLGATSIDKGFRPHYFQIFITEWVHVWYDYDYCSKIFHSTTLTCLCHLKVIEYALNRPIAKKSRLLFSSAEMFKKPLWQTVWTQIRLLL